MAKQDKRKLSGFSEQEREIGFVSFAPDLPPIQPTPDQFLDLYRKYSEYDELDLQPDFQRDFIWPIKKQKELIKSVWQGIPIPMFYFSRSNDGKYEVIDGQQRLTTLFGFYNKNSLPPNMRSRIIRNLNLKNSEGKRVSDEDIRNKMKRNLLLQCVIFDEENVNNSQKYEIFRRLNQGSMVLKAQEIRNCILQSAMPSFNSKIKSMAKYFESKFGREFRFVRMFGEEMVLRYFIIRKYGYEKKISDYIDFSVDKRLEIMRNDFCNMDEVKRYSRDFKQYIIRMYSLFGNNSFQVLKKGEIQPTKNSTDWNSHVFSGEFNQGLFHLFSYYMPKYNQNQFNKASSRKARAAFLRLLKNHNFVGMISGAATDQTWKIKKSKELFEREFLGKCFGIWTNREKRNISKQAKKTLFNNIPYCYLCYGKLKSIQAADHINPFCMGHGSKFSNILLAHTKCNNEKSGNTLADYRCSSKKLEIRIQKNTKHIKDYIKCLKSWNKTRHLKDFKTLIRYAKTDLEKII